MKRLQRPSEPPVCLSEFQHGRDNWENVTSEDKQKIWEKLDQMQHGLCAYCECKLRSKNKHIEHFRKKSQFPQLTFAWDNLFGSCDSKSRCGEYKDNKAGHFDDDDLLKPDQNDFSDYCVFLPTGKIIIKSNLEESNIKRVTETIRVFNLNNDPELVNRRRTAVLNIIHEIEAVYSLSEDVGLKSLFEEEKEKGIQATLNLEFQTALQHAWQYHGSA